MKTAVDSSVLVASDGNCITGAGLSINGSLLM
jgi:hypothetical protein